MPLERVTSELVDALETSLEGRLLLLNATAVVDEEEVVACG
jgi:hypothetical protein